jgi:Tol biopolymer transport system component/DNA-binding winged helix-turn-helix (wHTH) protein
LFPEADLSRYDGFVMTAEPLQYQFDTVEVRPASCEVLRAGSAVSLEPKAFRVLVYLIENRHRAVSKEELIGAIWEGAAVTDNALTRVVAQLRRELGDDARQARYIQTLPTLGYRFVAELKVQPGPTAEPEPARKRSRMALGVAALMLTGIVVLASWRTWPHRSADVRLQPVQLTTSPGIDAGGSFSPDGNSIVFSSDRNGGFEIYTRPVLAGSGHEVRLTSNGKQNIEPAWSPDGKWVAFHSAAAHGIWVVAAGGGEPRQISSFGSAPAWSPDSGQIAFRSVEPYSFAIFDLPGVGESTIWSVGLNGSRLRRLTNPQNPPGQHASPSWSPDGRRVLFTAFWSKVGLWTIDAGSGELKQVPAGDVRAPVLPVYAPDGGIYFAGPSRWGGFSIYHSRAPGEAPVELHEGNSGLPLQVAVSRDGRRLLYTRTVSLSQLWHTGGDSAPHALYRDTVVRARLPAFSPDGKRLAYMVQREGARTELWMMNADGSGAVAVTSAPGPQSSAGWTADGGAILYSFWDGGVSQLRRINPAGGAQRLLRRITEPIGQPHVWPDEREVVYAAGSPVNLWKLALPGGPAQQLTFEREAASYPSLSWDGEWIAYESQKGNTTQIKVIDRQGRRVSQLTDDEALNWSNSWAADNRRIAFASFQDGVWNIWWIDRATKQRKQITHHTAFGSFVRNPAWRPGTEEMVYEHWLVRGNIYLAEVPR